MSAKDSVLKGRAHATHTDGPALLGRKSVLMGMLASGFVIANTAHPRTASAGTIKPVAATLPLYITKWTPATAYTAGQQVISPTCDVVSAKVAHTSLPSYSSDAAKWALGCSDARRDAVGMFAKDNGVVGDGITNDGAALNALLASAASFGVPVVLTPLSIVFTSVGIVIPSNTRLNGNGATIKCGITSSIYTPTIGISGVSNVIIENLKVDGNKAAFAPATEFKHGIGMRTSTDVVLRNVTLNSNKGDGIEIAGDNATTWSERITLDNVTCLYNHRNGLSVIACKTLRVIHGSYSFSSGTSPQAGIDVEPNNAADPIEDLVFTDVLMQGNATCGFEVNLHTAPTAKQEGIRLTNCSMRGSAGAGAVLITAYHVTFTDCEFNDNRIGIEADTKVNHLTIKGGVVLRNTYRGIFGVSTSMNDWLISGVKILDNAGYGVLLNGAGHRFVIESNTIGNDTTSATQYGIATAVSTLTYVSIVNNYVRGLSGYALGLTDDATTRINRDNAV